MKRFAMRLTSYVLSAVMLVGMSGMNAKAATSASVLPSGGAFVSLGNGTELADVAKKNIKNNSNKRILSLLKEVEIITEESAATADSIDEEEELFKSLVIAQVNDYVNVRDLPDEKEGKIIGKLYDDSVGTFIEEENGWYKIKSGSVTGYVKGEYCVTGEEAIEIAKEVGTRLATVNTTTLKVRSDADIEASVLGLVPDGDDLVVLDETDEWIQVDVEEGIGWVSAEYVDIHTEFVKAESKEEEEARLKKEEEARKKAQAAAKKSSKSSNNTATSYVAVGGGSEMGNAVANYGLQFVGNPYVYGGTSLTNGADCSGFVMSVYANFGVSLPHSSASDRSQGYAVEGGLENAQPGDLICYSGHVAIYIGGGQIVHASNSRTGIIVSNASYRSILAIRRIF